MPRDSAHRLLVVFDNDGTLYQTERTIVEAVQMASRELGIRTASADEICAMVGQPMDDFCRAVAPDAIGDEAMRFKATVGKWERRLIPEVGRLFPGVKEALESLVDEGFELMVCSNAGLGYIEVVLKSCGIESHFSRIAPRQKGKSKNETLGEALAEIKPPGAVMIGDHQIDVDAAAANQIPSVLVEWGYGSAAANGATFTTPTPADLLGIIRRCDLYLSIEGDLPEPPSGKPLVVGVNGIDTAGKTTFARGLATYLRSRGKRVQLIHLDDFHNPAAVRSKGDNEIDAYLDNAFDLDLLNERLLAPISRGESLDCELELLDLDRDEYANRRRYRVDPDTIVILEGTLLFRPPQDRYFDYRIFLDIGFDEMMRRAEIRDVPLHGPAFLEKYRRKYIPIQKRYLRESAPRERCDALVDNRDWDRPALLPPGLRL